jgi:hypothetical protein
MASTDDTASGGQDRGAAPAAVETFVWIPEAAGLDGQAFVADAVHFADYDVIVQAPDGTITEAGYLPITGFSLAGQPVAPGGLNAPDGTGWGAYMRITGTGAAFVAPDGTPGATYDELSYEIVGFNGLATYGFGEDGEVFVAGEIGDPVVLLAGSLISGTVGFVPTEDGLTIEGTVSLTVDEVAPGFSLGPLDVFNLTILHPPEDYSFPTPTTTRVDAPSGTDGTFAAAEAPGDPAAPEGPADWDAIAARVTRAFEETGRWFDPGEPAAVSDFGLG